MSEFLGFRLFLRHQHPTPPTMQSITGDTPGGTRSEFKYMCISHSAWASYCTNPDFNFTNPKSQIPDPHANFGQRQPGESALILSSIANPHRRTLRPPCYSRCRSTVVHSPSPPRSPPPPPRPVLSLPDPSRECPCSVDIIGPALQLLLLQPNTMLQAA